MDSLWSVPGANFGTPRSLSRPSSETSTGSISLTPKSQEGFSHPSEAAVESQVLIQI